MLQISNFTIHVYYRLIVLFLKIKLSLHFSIVVL